MGLLGCCSGLAGDADEMLVAEREQVDIDQALDHIEQHRRI